MWPAKTETVDRAVPGNELRGYRGGIAGTGRGCSRSAEESEFPPGEINSRESQKYLVLPVVYILTLIHAHLKQPGMWTTVWVMAFMVSSNVSRTCQTRLSPLSPSPSHV